MSQEKTTQEPGWEQAWMGQAPRPVELLQAQALAQPWAQAS